MATKLVKKRYFIILFIVLVGIIYTIVNNNNSNTVNSYLSKQTDIINLQYKTIYNYNKTLADLIFKTYINNPQIIKLFKNKKREKLYDYLLKNYSEFKNISIKQLHFHLVNNESFLRMHKPTKFGDNLTNIRATVKYVNQYKKTIDGFEEGRIVNGFRFVYPLFDNKKHIGSVEISFSAFSFIKNIKKNYNINANLLVDKKVVETKVFKDEQSRYLKSAMPNFYIQKTIVEFFKFKSYLKKLVISKEQAMHVYKGYTKQKPFSIYHKQLGKVITYIPLQNPITKKSVAMLSFYSGAESIQKDIVNSRIIFFVLNFAILILLSIIYKDLRYKKELEETNIKLKKMTLELQKSDYALQLFNRTLKEKVEEQTEELQRNLNMISKYVIYSKTDLQGIISEVSEAFCEISLYSKDELIGKSHSLVRHPDMPKSVFKDMWTTIQEGKEWSGEIKNLKKDGSYYWVDVNISPEFDKDGYISNYIAIRYDITAKKDFQNQHKQLLQSEKMASLGEMIVNIAHQWRQPLSVISTSITGMKMQKEYDILTDESFDKTCDAINDKTQFLSKTIDDFRNYIDGDLKLVEFNLKDTMDSFLQLIDGEIKKNHINLILDIEENIRLKGYPNELKQCFMNIFNNAKDILKDKNEDERMIFIVSKKENDKIIINFKDSGGGVPNDIIDKIFEPYFTTKHKSQGTGLGLHMSYDMIVNSMGGVLEVENVTYEYEGKNYEGAMFTIMFSVI